MRNALVLFPLLITLAIRADEPRVHRLSPEANAAARAALAGAIGNGAIGNGTAFGDVVMIGPRLWARLREKFKPGDRVARSMVIFDGADDARTWGFVPADATDPTVKKVIAALADSPRRVAIETGAFRNGGAKDLGPEVARLLATPALPNVRDASAEEVVYLWRLVPYDLQEPLFVIEAGATRLLVNLDSDQKIIWIDLLP